MDGANGAFVLDSLFPTARHLLFRVEMADGCPKTRNRGGRQRASRVKRSQKKPSEPKDSTDDRRWPPNEGERRLDLWPAIRTRLGICCVLRLLFALCKPFVTPGHSISIVVAVGYVLVSATPAVRGTCFFCESVNLLHASQPRRCRRCRRRRRPGAGTTCTSLPVGPKSRRYDQGLLLFLFFFFFLVYSPIAVCRVGTGRSVPRRCCLIRPASPAR